MPKMALMRYFGGLCFKVKFLHAYRGHIHVLYIPAMGSNFLCKNISKNAKKFDEVLWRSVLQGKFLHAYRGHIHVLYIPAMG